MDIHTIIKLIGMEKFVYHPDHIIISNIQDMDTNIIVKMKHY